MRNLATFVFCCYFCLLLLKKCCSPTKTPPSRTGKHHGPEGRTSPRIAPKNSLTSLLKPIGNDHHKSHFSYFCHKSHFSYFCVLLLKRSLLKPIEHEEFSYFCLLLLLLSSAAEEVLLTHKDTTLPDGETPWP